MSTAVKRHPILYSVAQRLAATAEYQRLLDEVQRGTRVISISGLITPSAKGLVLATLQCQTGRLFAVVTQANRDLEQVERDLRFWYCALSGKSDCEDDVLLLPASESDPYAGSSPHAETLEQRALTLWRLVHHPQDFVLLTARALARKTVAPSAIARAGVEKSRRESG